MLAYLFVILAVLGRFLVVGSAWNFTPVTAALLYFGARAPRKHMWFPIVMLIGSDIALSRLVFAYPLTPDLLASWAWYALALLLGSAMLKGESKPLRVGAGALAGSLSFFVLSNFAVWAVWNIYPKTLEGLVASYVAAIPFFRNAIVADVAFSFAFFFVPGLVMSLVKKPALKTSY